MFTSYAQNFEDVLLWRALSDVDDGFYIDVGAHHPRVDSVSQAFFDHGWTGMHVEPTPGNAELLRRHRPGDTVIEAAVSAKRGKLTFHEIKGTGLSTLDPAALEAGRARGFAVENLTVDAITLDDVFKRAARPVHWLKIDVEGHEKAVLRGWRSAVRPWILVIESTLPGSRVEVYEEWEPLVLKKDYVFVYFDGLNRYYVHRDHAERLEYFSAPPNVFDTFTLSGESTASFARGLTDQITELRTALSKMQGLSEGRRLRSSALERIRRRRKTRRQQ